MLGTTGAKNPIIFKITNQTDNYLHTNSINGFYAPPKILDKLNT